MYAHASLTLFYIHHAVQTKIAVLKILLNKQDFFTARFYLLKVWCAVRDILVCQCPPQSLCMQGDVINLKIRINFDNILIRTTVYCCINSSHTWESLVWAMCRIAWCIYNVMLCHKYRMSHKHIWRWYWIIYELNIVVVHKEHWNTNTKICQCSFTHHILAFLCKSLEHF